MQQKYKIGVAQHIINKPGRDAGVNHAIDWRPVEFTKDDIIRTIRKGWAISAHYDGNYRKTENFICCGFVAADMDGNVTLDEVQEIPLVRNHASFIYTSVSHTEDCHRFRVVFLLDEPVTVAKTWADCLTGIAVSLDGDRSSNNAGKLFYGNTNAIVIELGGTLPQAEVERLATIGADQRDLIKLRRKSDGNAALQARTRLPRDIEVRQRNGQIAPLKDLRELTPIHCPVHHDENPSAVVVQSSDKGMKGVWCSACGRTFWTETPRGYDFDIFDYLVQERVEAAELETIHAANPLAAMFPPSPPVFEMQQRFLPPISYEPGITLVKSPKGSGKTAAIAALIEQIREQRFASGTARADKSNSVLLIGHRRSLIREASKRLNIDCYLGELAPDEAEGADIDGDDPDFMQLQDVVPMPDPTGIITFDGKNTGGRNTTGDYINHKMKRFGYAICLDSLHKVVGGPKYHTIIIDECEQVISHLLSETIQKSKSSTLVFAALRWVLQHARSIYVLDADVGLITLHALKVLRPDLWAERLRIIYNKPLAVENRRTINLYASRASILKRLTNAIEAGKRCFVTTNSRTAVKTIARMLTDTFGPELKIKAIDSDNSQVDDIARFIHDIQREILEQQVVVCSPSLGTGIDITFPDGACEIDEVFGLFSPYVNKHTDIDQQLARVRNPGNVSVWFGGGSTNFETNTDVVRDQLARANYVPSALLAHIDPDTNALAYRRDDPLLNIMTHVRVAQWASQNNIQSLFEKLRQENGWDFNRIKADKANDGQDPFPTVKLAVEADRVELVIKARDLTDQEYREFSQRKQRGQQIRGENRLALERAMIERLWQKPATPEMVGEFSQGSLIDQIVAYSQVFEATPKDFKILAGFQEAFDPSQPLTKTKPYFMAMRLLFTTPLIENGELMVDRVMTKLDFSQFIKVVHDNRVTLQDVFGVAPRKDLQTNPVKMLGEYLKCFGLRMKTSSRVTINGEKLQSYKLDSNRVDTMREVSSLFRENYYHIYPWRDQST